jgi:hypothetical protein
MPVAYWVLEAIARTGEALFELLERDDLGAAIEETLTARAASVARAARRYARLFPIGRPQALLAAGSLAWVRRRSRQAHARWRQALRIAQRLDMPYEAARAHAEIGRHLAPGAPTRHEHLAEAAAIFAQIGAAWDLAIVRSARDGLPVVTPASSAA